MATLDSQFPTSFKTSCPRCKAKAEDARLEVISGTFVTVKMYLQPEGFSFTDAKLIHTDNEKVQCAACKAVFDLNECLQTEPQ